MQELLTLRVWEKEKASVCIFFIDMILQLGPTAVMYTYLEVLALACELTPALSDVKVS